MRFTKLYQSSNLKYSYEIVGKKIWDFSDFDLSFLKSSRNFFTNESLLDLKPIPKNLEVYALVSGIEFTDGFKQSLSNIQMDLGNILKNKLYYFVKPENLGVEYCVFKWPDGPWEKDWLSRIKSTLATLKISPFTFNIFGVQIHQDGCIVAKGYDENSSIFKVRQTLKDSLSFLPPRQSGWAHVPLGRILEPVGSEIFEELRMYIKKIDDCLIASQKIKLAKLVHEKQWYMESKEILSEVSFS